MFANARSSCSLLAIRTLRDGEGLRNTAVDVSPLDEHNTDVAQIAQESRSSGQAHVIKRQINKRGLSFQKTTAPHINFSVCVAIDRGSTRVSLRHAFDCPSKPRRYTTQEPYHHGDGQVRWYRVEFNLLNTAHKNHSDKHHVVGEAKQVQPSCTSSTHRGWVNLC